MTAQLPTTTRPMRGGQSSDSSSYAYSNGRSYSGLKRPSSSFNLARNFLNITRYVSRRSQESLYIKRGKVFAGIFLHPSQGG